MFLVYFNQTTLPDTQTYLHALKTFIKQKFLSLLQIVYLSKFPDFDSTLTTLPSAGEITVSSMSGVNLFGSLKK